MHYNDLYSSISEDDIGQIDSGLDPVSVGDRFMVKTNKNNHYRTCEIKRVYNYAFVYEYLNETLKNELINEHLITFLYWNTHKFRKKNIGREHIVLCK